jgi:DNA-binding XRE family transcriptional regulator
MVNKVRSIDFVFRKTQFATDILACRAELGYTQREVAKHLNVTEAALGSYENALEDNPKMLHFLSVCNLYDLDPRDYFELGE